MIVVGQRHVYAIHSQVLSMILNAIKRLSSLLQHNEILIDWKRSKAFYPVWLGGMLEAFTIQSLCLIVASQVNDYLPWENPGIKTSSRKQ